MSIWFYLLLTPTFFLFNFDTKYSSYLISVMKLCTFHLWVQTLRWHCDRGLYQVQTGRRVQDSGGGRTIYSWTPPTPKEWLWTSGGPGHICSQFPSSGLMLNRSGPTNTSDCSWIIDWTGQLDTDPLHRKGQSRLYFLRRLGSFDICRKLQLKSVVARAIFYAAVCWGGSVKKRDATRPDRLGRRAGSVLGSELESLVSVADIRSRKQTAGHCGQDSPSPVQPWLGRGAHSVAVAGYVCYLILLLSLPFFYHLILKISVLSISPFAHTVVLVARPASPCRFSVLILVHFIIRMLLYLAVLCATGCLNFPQDQ